MAVSINAFEHSPCQAQPPGETAPLPWPAVLSSSSLQ